MSLNGHLGWEGRAIYSRIAQPRCGAFEARAAPGAVYIVDDSAVRYPDHLDRVPHTTGRRVIVVQSQVYSKGFKPSSILVVPCSTSHKGEVGGYDYEIPATETAFTGERVVAYTTLVMPVSKRMFRSYVGKVTDDTLFELQTRLLRLIDLSGDEPEPA